MFILETAGITTHTGSVTTHATETLNGGNKVGEINVHSPMKGMMEFLDVVF